MLEYMFSGTGASSSQPRCLGSVADIFQQRTLGQLPLQLTHVPQQPQVASPRSAHDESPHSSRQLAITAAVESPESQPLVLRQNTPDLAATPEPVRRQHPDADTPAEPLDDIQNMLNALNERKQERKAHQSTGSRPSALAATAPKADPAEPRKRPAAAVASDSDVVAPEAGDMVAPEATGKSPAKAKAKGTPQATAKAKATATIAKMSEEKKVAELNEIRGRGPILRCFGAWGDG